MSDYGKIIRRFDGSYVINNGLYHVPVDWELWRDVNDYADANPQNVEHELEPKLTEIQKIDKVVLKYAADLSRLITACSAAQMLGDLEDVEEIKEEYADLLRQQGEEIAAIQNGGA